MNEAALPLALLSFKDLTAFETQEADLVHRVEELPAFRRSVAEGELQNLARQAAWLTIERTFLDNPTLDAINIVVDKDDNDGMVFVLVRTRRAGEDRFNGFGDDEAGLDEDIQMHLNDMGRNQHTSFFEELSGLQVSATNLNACADRLFGSEWSALRREQRLLEQLPSEQLSTTPKPPRF